MIERRSNSGEPGSGARVVVMGLGFPALSQTFVLDQVEALRSAGLAVDVVAATRDESGLLHERGRRLAGLASYPEDRMAAPRFVPHFIWRRLFPKQRLVRAYRKALEGADLVLCHFGPAGLNAARALASDRHCRLWTIFHGFDLTSYVKLYGPNVYAPLFERGDRFLAVSRLWMERLEALGCPRDRIGLLRMGVEVDCVRFAPPRSGPGRPFRILTVSRLVEKKGIEYGLRAVAELARARPDLDWTYEIVGEGALRGALEALSRQLGIHDRVEFAGSLSAAEVLERLRSSDIFLLPSITAQDGDMEGVPVSLMEAMAVGVPVLSTFHSGIPELIDHGESGLLAPERDYLSLARNIEQLLDQPDLRRSLAADARRKVEQEFNQRLITEQLIDDIRRALRTDR
jgi:colanic acid/amylovoran biosynthesis glycosyltransferase